MKEKKIVLIHGWGSGVRKLEPLGKALSDFGWEVLIPKLPGFDINPPKEIWGITEYSRYIQEEIKDHFGSNKYLVFGHSFGGMIAIKLSSSCYNDKNNIGIILCNTNGISRPNLLKRLFFLVSAKIGKFIFFISPSITKLLRKLLYKLAKVHDYEKCEGIMKEIFEKVVATNCKPEIKNIKIPTLILWGEKDNTTDLSDAYFIKKSLPEAELTIYKNEGHLLPYNQPEKIAKSINEWSESIPILIKIFR